MSNRTACVDIRSVTAVYLVAYLLVLLQVQITQNPLMPSEDALGYVRLADNLAHRNTLTIAAESTEPSSFFPPLYPAFLAVLASVDTQFGNVLACFGAAEFDPTATTCVPEFGSAIYVQIGLAALTLTLIWISGVIIFRSNVVAAIAVASAWGTGRFAEIAVVFLTENLYLPCFATASLMLLLAVRDQRLMQCALCGVAIGLASLTRPTAQYASYVMLFILIAFGMRACFYGQSTKLLIGAALFVVAYCGTISPWLLRNNLQFDRIVLTEGYASEVLVERLSYNHMTWRELAIAPIYWLPGPGELLAKRLFHEDDYRRLDLFADDGFYRIGVGRDRTNLKKNFPTEADRMAHLLEDRLLNEPLKHSLVTVALAYRGIWIVKYWTLIAVPAMLYLFVRSFWNRSKCNFAVFVLPSLFMLFFHAFVSSNVHRYNLILIPGLALSCGWLMVHFSERCGLLARLSRFRDIVKLDRD